MSASTYLGNAILNMILKAVSFTPLGVVSISYHYADPGLTGANEVSGNGYARKAVVGADWGTVANKTVENINAITFPVATGGQGVVTHVGVWDSLTGGNFLAGATLVAPVTIDAGDTPQFGVGALDLTII